jgi:hypothetical protein
MLAFADMVDFFAHEFAGLGARRFAGMFIASCSRDRRFLRHTSPPPRRAVQRKYHAAVVHFSRADVLTFGVDFALSLQPVLQSPAIFSTSALVDLVSTLSNSIHA